MTLDRRLESITQTTIPNNFGDTEIVESGLEKSLRTIEFAIVKLERIGKKRKELDKELNGLKYRDFQEDEEGEIDPEKRMILFESKDGTMQRIKTREDLERACGAIFSEKNIENRIGRLSVMSTKEEAEKMRPGIFDEAEKLNTDGIYYPELYERMSDKVSLIDEFRIAFDFLVDAPSVETFERIIELLERLTPRSVEYDRFKYHSMPHTFFSVADISSLKFELVAAMAANLQEKEIQKYQERDDDMALFVDANNLYKLKGIYTLKESKIKQWVNSLAGEISGIERSNKAKDLLMDRLKDFETGLTSRDLDAEFPRLFGNDEFEVAQVRYENLVNFRGIEKAEVLRKLDETYERCGEFSPEELKIFFEEIDKLKEREDFSLLELKKILIKVVHCFIKNQPGTRNEGEWFEMNEEPIDDFYIDQLDDARTEYLGACEKIEDFVDQIESEIGGIQDRSMALALTRELRLAESHLTERYPRNAEFLLTHEKDRVSPNMRIFREMVDRDREERELFEEDMRLARIQEIERERNSESQREIFAERLKLRNRVLAIILAIGTALAAGVATYKVLGEENAEGKIDDSEELNKGENIEVPENKPLEPAQNLKGIEDEDDLPPKDLSKEKR